MMLLEQLNMYRGKKHNSHAKSEIFDDITQKVKRKQFIEVLRETTAYCETRGFDELNHHILCDFNHHS